MLKCEGIKSVKVIDLGVGETLEIELENGFKVLVDALGLAGANYCQVGVWVPAVTEEFLPDHLAAGVTFGTGVAVEAETYPIVGV